MYSRAKIDGVYFDSGCYRRCPRGPNSYFRTRLGNAWDYGRVECFIALSDEDSIGGTVYAFFTRLHCFETLNPCRAKYQRDFFNSVRLSPERDLIGAREFEKMLCIEDDSETYLCAVPKFIDHK